MRARPGVYPSLSRHAPPRESAPARTLACVLLIHRSLSIFCAWPTSMPVCSHPRFLYLCAGGFACACDVLLPISIFSFSNGLSYTLTASSSSALVTWCPLTSAASRPTISASTRCSSPENLRMWLSQPRCDSHLYHLFKAASPHGVQSHRYIQCHFAFDAKLLKFVCYIWATPCLSIVLNMR